MLLSVVSLTIFADSTAAVKNTPASQQTYSSSSKFANQTYPSITNEAEYAEFVRAQEGLSSSSSSKQKSSVTATKRVETKAGANN